MAEREMLFRAKAINRDEGYHRTTYKNGDWVYGLVTRLYDERFENLPAEMTDINGVSGIEVDYKTIGQYTGLTDKNGKRIFEGDIVSLVKHDGLIYKVVYVPCRYELVNSKGVNCFVLDIYKSENIEVIGNIYDNPELLGGENNGINR